MDVLQLGLSQLSHAANLATYKCEYLIFGSDIRPLPGQGAVPVAPARPSPGTISSSNIAMLTWWTTTWMGSHQVYIRFCHCVPPSIATLPWQT